MVSSMKSHRSCVEPPFGYRLVDLLDGRAIVATLAASAWSPPGHATTWHTAHATRHTTALADGALVEL